MCKNPLKLTAGHGGLYELWLWSLQSKSATLYSSVFSDQNSAHFLEDFVVYSLFLVEMLKWQLLKFFILFMVGKADGH